MGIDPLTGCGRRMQLSKFTYSPWYDALSSFHNARIAAMFSSLRFPRSLNGTPIASNSSFIQPTPVPSSMRPFDMKSSVASSFASTTGLRCGKMRIPVARLISLVAAAMYVSQIRGSGIGESSPPGILPVSLYGYGDW